MKCFIDYKKKLIKADLEDYESAINQLCGHRLRKARSIHSPDLSLSEVQDTISELKEGRCIEPTCCNNAKYDK